MPERCAATTKGGRPCGGTPAPGESLCPWHSPAWAERRRQWSVKGGQGKSAAARARKALPEPMSAAELQAVLSATIKGVLGRAIEPAIGNCVANLARSLVVVREATETEQRVAALEQAAAEAQARARWGA